MSTSLPIRIAVVGARRGRTFMNIAKMLPDKVRLEAVCDVKEDALQEWRNTDVRVHDSFEKLLDDPDVDAVCLATPVTMHARQAIAALDAGKHVLSEVTAAWTLEECHELVAASKRSKSTYMMAENYCFRREVLMVQNMVEQGVFGDIIYAEGAYIHQIINLLFDEGELTWRGLFRRDEFGNTYPTHSLGPVSRWLGIGRDDFYTTTASFQSGTHMVPIYAAKNLPEGHPDRNVTYKASDAVTTMLHTEKGVLVDIRVDWASPRPHNMVRYALQGTKAGFIANIDPSLDPQIWIEGRSPEDEHGGAKSWESLWKYADEFEHPWWKEAGSAAAKTGHGGSDFFVLREFADAINEGREPVISVEDAVTWSSITPLSKMSIEGGNIPVQVPRF